LTRGMLAMTPATCCAAPRLLVLCGIMFQRAGQQLASGLSWPAWLAPGASKTGERRRGAAISGGTGLSWLGAGRRPARQPAHVASRNGKSCAARSDGVASACQEGGGIAWLNADIFCITAIAPYRGDSASYSRHTRHAFRVTRAVRTRHAPRARNETSGSTAGEQRRRGLWNILARAGPCGRWTVMTSGLDRLRSAPYYLGIQKEDGGGLAFSLALSSKGGQSCGIACLYLLLSAAVNAANCSASHPPSGEEGQGAKRRKKNNAQTFSLVPGLGIRRRALRGRCGWKRREAGWQLYRV